MLPLSSSGGSVAVIGPAADAAPTYAGGGSAYVIPSGTVSPLAGIKAAAGSGTKVGIPAGPARGHGAAGRSRRPACPRPTRPRRSAAATRGRSPRRRPARTCWPSPTRAAATRRRTCRWTARRSSTTRPRRRCTRTRSRFSLIAGKTYTLAISGASSAAAVGDAVVAGAGHRRRGGRGQVGVGRRGRGVRPRRVRGHGPAVAEPAVGPGRADLRGRGGEPAHGRGRQRGRAGRDAVAAAGGGRGGRLVPGPDQRDRAGQRAVRPDRSRRPPAGDVPGVAESGARPRPRPSSPATVRRCSTRRASDVGYRWYDAKGIVPLFPFGFGLSYTRFAFSHLSVSRSADGRDAGRAGVRGGDQHRPPGRVRRWPSSTWPTRPAPGSRRGSWPASSGSAWRRAPRRGSRSRSLRSRSPGGTTPAKGWTQTAGRYQVYVGDSSARADLPLRGVVHHARHARGPSGDGERAVVRGGRARPSRCR